MIHDLIIVGAGPSGLATAIAAKEQGLDYLIVEKGVLVNSIYQFPAHMVFFTTPELMEIGGLPLVTPYEKPTRLEALRYYRRVADKFELQIQFGTRVTGIVREPSSGVLAVTAVRDSDTTQSRTFAARAVVLALGYYDHPNRLNVPGEDLPHVSHYYRDAHSSYRQNVVVVGGKNSAAEAALELHRGGAHVTLIHRRKTLGASIKYWVKPDIENRIKEGSIAARFNTRAIEIRPTSVLVETDGVQSELDADAVFLLTGYSSDNQLLKTAGVGINPETCGPVFHPETFETNVRDLYVAGAVVAGLQSGRIFIENGRFHGQQVIDAIVRKQGVPRG
jgi:thioredoxin reductase (NADPH)